MGQRKIRVGELIRRELSEILHSRWRSEAVAITITEVDVSPDLRNARVYYSVVGARADAARAGRLLASIKGELKRILSKKIILKYTPELVFAFDPSGERAMKIIAALDELEASESSAESGATFESSGDAEGSAGNV